MLRSLEQVWTSHEQDFRLIMEQRFNDHQKALHIWIGQRRKTSQLQMMIDRQPSAQTLEMVDRVLVMNDLRILQLKWKALRVHVHSQDSTPGDLLCSTFAIMTRTQGTEALFKEGLERLKETSPEDGNNYSDELNNTTKLLNTAIERATPPPAGATSPPSSKLQPHLTHPTLPIATSATSATSASALAIAATALIILTTLTTFTTFTILTILTILTIHALDRWLVLQPVLQAARLYAASLPLARSLRKPGNSGDTADCLLPQFTTFV
ncbi:hypothetical protein PtrEW7m1_011726 [Pyrenophora tritici-repentis]|nr:hypothetical protein PtrEW7m1_011726 [Pyrenophora tritici-repentis]